MPAMRISILNVPEDITPLKFRGWLRNEAASIQHTSRSESDIIIIRIFITEMLRFALTQAKLDKILNSVVDRHPNIFRIELQIGKNFLTENEMKEAANEANADLQKMVGEIQSDSKKPTTFH